MRTLANIKNDFLVQNQSSTSVAFYTDTILNDWADKAHKYSAGYKKWAMTEGRVSTTFASLYTNEDGYLTGDYFEGWKPDSIRLLTIGAKEVAKKNFYSFRRFLEDNTSSTERIYSDFGRQYFVNPTIDLSGTVTAWGQFTPATLDGTVADALTIFSDVADEGNEALVELMQSYAKKREKKVNESIAHLKEANRILDELWIRLQDEQFEYQQTRDDGMFKRMDLLKGALRDDIFKRDQFY